MRSHTGLAAVLALVAAAGCHTDRPDGGSTAEAGCTLAGPPVVLPDDVRESSGVEPVSGAEGLFWTHNDSGWGPDLHAISADGRLVATVRVRGATNRDWEDMAAGPCDAGRCLYLGDIGDNDARHEEIVLWRIPEPAPRGGRTDAPAERFAARYPGGPRDAEGLFVLPDGAVYVVTKGREAPVELFRWPTPLEAGPVELQSVRVLRPAPEQVGDMATGAASSPDGRWVAIRSYATLDLWRTETLLGGGGSPELIVDLLALGEPQGEAVAFARGDTLLLTSEGTGEGSPPRATRLVCRLPGGR
jgi:hypothetical protein